jgi:hypothetical protein
MCGSFSQQHHFVVVYMEPCVAFDIILKILKIIKIWKNYTLGNQTKHLKFYTILCQKRLKYFICQIKRINTIEYVDRHTPIRKS